MNVGENTSGTLTSRMAASLNRIGIIFAKEVRDNLRDHRSIFSALSSTLIGPAIMVVMVVVVGKSIFADMTEKPVHLPVVGAENAPALMQVLTEYNIIVEEPPADIQQAIRNGEYDVALVIPDDYSENFSQGQPARIEIVLDTSRQSSIAAIERIRKLLDGYNQQIASLRLMARGVSPTVITPISIEQTDMATPQSQALIFLNMLPYFVVLVVFVGGMYVIIDTTAGERERGSLEPLLILPVKRWEFVIGKLLSSLPFAIFTVFLTLLAFAAAFNLIPLEDYVGFQLTVDPAAMAVIFLIALPMVLLASALQMIVATFTRSFKEAQTYVSFLPLIPSLPGIGLAFLPVKATLGIMLIPTFGQQLLINQVMRGEPVSLLNVAVSAAVTMLAALLLIYAAVRLYSREQIIFGTK